MLSNRAGPAVALVVGGTKGIGRAASFALAHAGFHVVACSRGRADVEKLADDARREAQSIEAVICDAANDDDLARFIDEAAAKHGRIDALVFTAGKAFRGSVLDLTPADWDACLGINLRAPFVAAKQVLPHMVRQKSGSIVFISSIWAVTTPRKRAGFVVAKSGLQALARAIAVDHGEHGIRANCVAPGYVDTDFLRRSLADIHGPDRVEALFADIVNAHPSRRLVTPENVAATVAFLAGPQGAGTNGQAIIVDGGSTARFSLADMWN
jgi:meso-butanediol dehydrogenase/(S,S)-butanediol dehydrogenase/diacetyl reductase